MMQDRLLFFKCSKTETLQQIENLFGISSCAHTEAKNPRGILLLGALLRQDLSFVETIDSSNRNSAE